MEWGALILPAIGVAIAAVFFYKRLVWWEIGLPFAVAAILIVICKGCTELVQVTDTEYWTGYGLEARYYEDWDEEVPCTHWECVEEDEDGNCTDWEQEHSYDVDYHPEYWEILDNNGLTVRLEKSRYQELIHRWGKPQFVDMHRDYHLDDGDMYRIDWPHSDSTIEVVTTTHFYENRVQASQSVFNFQEVSKEDRQRFQLVDYPKVNGYYDCPSILGAGAPRVREAERILSIVNAKLGQKKRIRVFVLIFRNQALQAAQAQEALWKRGNKNELDICIGLNDRNQVQWVHPFSWTPAPELPIMVRDRLSKEKGAELDLIGFIKWLEPEIESKWEKKNFREFDYITVEPPGWMIVLTYVFVGLVTGACVWWSLVNQFGGRETWAEQGIYRYRR